MAVEDKYVNTERAAGDRQDNVLMGGGEVVYITQKFEVVAADSDGSVYRVFSVPSNGVPLPGGVVYHDSITGGTDYEFGLWYTGVGGAAVDQDCFLGSTDFANTTTRDPFSLAMTVDNADKTFWEIAGLSSDPKVMLDWGIIGNTVGSADGTITVSARYIRKG